MTSNVSIHRQMSLHNVPNVVERVRDLNDLHIDIINTKPILNNLDIEIKDMASTFIIHSTVFI